MGVKVVLVKGGYEYILDYICNVLFVNGEFIFEICCLCLVGEYYGLGCLLVSFIVGCLV